MADNDFESYEKIYFTKFSNSLNLDEKTKENSCQYFINYKHNQRDMPFNFKIVMACCVLIAAKSQLIKTLEGKLIRGVGISINQIIKVCKELSVEEKFNIKDFLFQLKQFINFVKLDSEIQIIVKESIKRFVFIHLFHCKFTEILNSFLIQNNDERELNSRGDDEYLRKGREMGWLLFVVLQNLLFDINSKDVGPNACLLLSVLYELLSTMPEKFYLKAVLNESLVDSTSGGIDNQKLIEALCQEMKIKHIDVFYDFYEKQFKEQLQWLSRQENVVISRENTKNLGVFQEEYLIFNYNKLDQFYQKSIGFDNIDERFFISERSLQTVTKFTPFTPLPRSHVQTDLNGVNSNSSVLNKRSFLKNLNFETAANNDFNINSTLSDLRNKKIPESPSFTAFDNNTNPCQTPMSQQIEMYNWLCECIKKVRPNKEQEYVIPHLQKYIDLFEKEKDLKAKMFLVVEEIIKKVENTSEKSQQIFLLYLRVLDEMIRIEEKKLEEKNLNSLDYYEFVRNLEFHRSLTAICIETIFFINNKEMDLQNLFSHAQIQPFDFWKMINSFVKFDKKMPSTLKDHFQIIEKMIIFGYAWKSGSTLDKLIKNFEDKSKHDSIKQEKTENTIQNNAKCLIKTEIFLNRSEEVFFKKVIYYTASQILDICEMLNLNDSITENVWQTITYILSNETRLLINRNLNHLIISSVYAICKNDKIKLNFDDILQKYKAFSHIKNITEFSRKIELNNNEQGDIIKFYNEIFIPAVRNFIKSLKSNPSSLSPISPINHQYPKSEHKKPMVPIFSIQSPLRETLNSSYNFPMSVNNKKYSSTLMTPLTKTLYAFGESLESPHKNYMDFKQKIMNNPRMLKRIDFDNYDLMGKTKIIKKENKIDETKLKLKPQFFNFVRKESFPSEPNLKIISNFNDDEMIEEKMDVKSIESTDKKVNKTPEFKKEGI